MGLRLKDVAVGVVGAAVGSGGGGGGGNCWFVEGDGVCAGCDVAGEGVYGWCWCACWARTECTGHRPIGARGGVLVSGLALLRGGLLLLLEKIMLPVKLLPLRIHVVEGSGSKRKTGKRTVRARMLWRNDCNIYENFLSLMVKNCWGVGKTTSNGLRNEQLSE